MDKRTKISNHFENPNPNLNRRQNMPGDMEIIRDLEERGDLDRSKAELRKNLFDFIRANPGCNIAEMKRHCFSTDGITEWVRDGLITKENGRYRLA